MLLCIRLVKLITVRISILMLHSSNYNWIWIFGKYYWGKFSWTSNLFKHRQFIMHCAVGHWTPPVSFYNTSMISIQLIHIKSMGSLLVKFIKFASQHTYTYTLTHTQISSHPCPHPYLYPHWHIVNNYGSFNWLSCLLQSGLLSKERPTNTINVISSVFSHKHNTVPFQILSTD